MKNNLFNKIFRRSKGHDNSMAKENDNIQDRELKKTNDEGEIANLNPQVKSNERVVAICKDLSEYAEEIGASMSELSNFTDNQAAYVEQFSAALEEVSSGVQQTAENTQHASQFVLNVQNSVNVLVESVEEIASVSQELSSESQNARTAAGDGERVITDAINEMNNVSTRIKDLAENIALLGESANEIGKILDVINSIANQTNMLALNASIEAARAGEYGRGFSVVAKSIKELADKSKDATNNISGIIKNIQNGITEAVDRSNKGLKELDLGMSLIKATGDSMSNILQVVDKTYEHSMILTESTRLQDEASKEIMISMNELSEVICEVSATTMQESASIQQVASGVEIIKECIDEIVAGTEELSTFSTHLSEGAKQLIDAV